jgi:hypothetical protein
MRAPLTACDFPCLRPLPVDRCHPWSSGVTKWLTEHALGVQPLRDGAGFRRFRARPELSACIQRVNGTAASPKGPIAVHMEWTDDAGSSRAVLLVTVPDGAAGVVELPRMTEVACAQTEADGEAAVLRRTARVLMIDGAAVSMAGVTVINGDGEPAAAETEAGAEVSSWLRLPFDLQAGAHRVEVLYEADSRVDAARLSCGARGFAVRDRRHPACRTPYRSPAAAATASAASSSSSSSTAYISQSDGLVYAARFVGTDNVTAGDWASSTGPLGAFGTDGFVLLSFDGPGQHRMQLPDYVLSIDHLPHNRDGGPKDLSWANDTDDTRALVAGPGNDTRVAAALCTSALRRVRSAPVSLTHPSPVL